MLRKLSGLLAGVALIVGGFQIFTDDPVETTEAPQLTIGDPVVDPVLRHGITTTTTSTTTTQPRKAKPPLQERQRPQRASRSAPRSNGSLERIAQCELGGNYTARNKTSSASGKYQYLDSTWNGYKGYKSAADAPPEVQEERARSDYARVGSRPWNASRHCWG